MPTFLGGTGQLAGPVGPLEKQKLTWDNWLGHEDSENECVRVTGKRSTLS